MAPPQRPLDDPASAFHLGAWRVDPALNRVTRDGKAERVEPKMMDVLCFMAAHPQQVVSKNAITDAVWPEVFITESVITRAIAGLRRALGDDARAPRYIETIAKRGYRLLESPTPIPDPQPPSTIRGPVANQPFVRSPAELGAIRSSAPVGQWVCGDRFVGRKAEIAEILDGSRNGIWLLGTRAVGKTSLLKQLEHLTAADPQGRYLPVFWDLQGTTDLDTFHDDFIDALSDAEDRLDRLGLRVADLEAESFFRTLGRLRRALRAQGRTLLLLWDEVEELIHLHAKSPSLLRKLRRALQSQEGIRTVMASSTRLWQLADQRDDTSPFLHGFAPPMYLGPLDDPAARHLVRQHAHSVFENRDLVDVMIQRCGGHPSLLHLLATRLRDVRDIDEATAAVTSDATVQFLFAADFDLFNEDERALLLALGRHEQECDVAALEGDASKVATHLHHLEQLGLVRCHHRSKSDRRASIAHPILHQWLREHQG